MRKSLTKEQIIDLLKGIVWDYNIDPYQLYKIAIGNQQQIAFFSKEKVIQRMLERLSWYELLELFGLEFIGKNLSPEIINGIRDKQLKDKYELIRKVLQGEHVSFTGWSDENRERFKSSLLSNRWNRP